MQAFEELVAMVRVKRQMGKAKVTLRPDQEDLRFCYDILPHVSRSFAAVICQLNDELRDAICIFYLVLRALDTVEDDMSIPIPTKKECLPIFHEHLFVDDWSIDGIGKGHEKILLQQFFRLAKEFQKLKPQYRDVIVDICKRMADGMCYYLDHEVAVQKDYDLYCHYVAGLVGHGLTRIFAETGFEDHSIADDLEIANSMGLFLQKANIIRDYYEDIMESPPRMFWPREIWGLFGTELADFKAPENRARALECVNAMIADALKLIPHCIQYLSVLKDPTVFLFCAIPQLMAIATLELLYNNYGVFNSKQKIRKGVACKIILECSDLQRALRCFSGFLDSLEKKLIEDDPSYDVSRQLIADARTHIAKRVQPTESYARTFFMQYPALGGRLLTNIVDSAQNMFRGN